MKKIVKFSIVAVLFGAALLVNVSFNASKDTVDNNLFGFTSKANAKCEEAEWDMNTGYCNINLNCHVEATKPRDCDASIH